MYRLEDERVLAERNIPQAMTNPTCPDCGRKLEPTGFQVFEQDEYYCPECSAREDAEFSGEDDYDDYDPDAPVTCFMCGTEMVLTGRDDYGGDMDAVCDHYYCEKCENTTEQNCIEDWEYDDE